MLFNVLLFTVSLLLVGVILFRQIVAIFVNKYELYIYRASLLPLDFAVPREARWMEIWLEGLPGENSATRRYHSIARSFMEFFRRNEESLITMPSALPPENLAENQG